MGRYSDEWLIDRTLFDYVQGGSCTCCSFATFLPNGTEDLIRGMSELETDAVNAELDAYNTTPWPKDMKDNIWMERVRIRQKCKSEMKNYREFWNTHGDAYKQWMAQQSPKRIISWFQLSRQEIIRTIHQSYKLHQAFATVITAVVEQVAHFEATGYPTDGRGHNEVNFENVLTYSRRGGFLLKDILIPNNDNNNDNNQRVINMDVLHIWFQRHQSLAGPKLLERAPKKKQQQHDDDDDSDGDDNDNEDGNDDDAEAVTAEPGASQHPAGATFRADRRIVRLMIARYWANVVQQAYLKDIKDQQGDDNAEKGKDTTHNADLKKK